MRTNIFDRSNCLIGWTLESIHQVQIFDRTGRLWGFYVKQSDTTHSAHHGFFGRGNQLLRLLK